MSAHISLFISNEVMMPPKFFGVPCVFWHAEGRFYQFRDRQLALNATLALRDQREPYCLTMTPMGRYPWNQR